MIYVRKILSSFVSKEILDMQIGYSCKFGILMKKK